MFSVSLFKEPLMKGLLISLLLHGVVFAVLNNYSFNNSPVFSQEYSSVQIEFRTPVTKQQERVPSELPEIIETLETLETVVEDPVPVMKNPEKVESQTSLREELIAAVPSPEENSPPTESVQETAVPSSSDLLKGTTTNPLPAVSQGSQEYSDLETVMLGDVRIPAPVYPGKAKQMGWEGDVQIHFIVSPKGRPEDIVLKQSSGYELLDQAVLDTVKKRWRLGKDNAGRKLKKTFSFRLI